MRLTQEQLAFCATQVSELNWTWSALTACAYILGIRVPATGCWKEVASLGLLDVVCQVAVELQGTALPASLKLSLGVGTR